MKYVDEYRDGDAARQYVAALERAVTRPWALMEICGGQTHTFMKSGVDQLLPEEIELVHGPGCPVCVTPLEQIDRALAIAARPEVIFTSFGDMLRVPGSSDADLLSAKSAGADVRMVYSPLDAVEAGAEAKPETRRRLLRGRLRDDGARQRDGGAGARATSGSRTSRSCSARTCCVPPAMEAILSPIRATACRAFSPPATSAR